MVDRAVERRAARRVSLAQPRGAPRISTHSRASDEPLTSAQAWQHVEDWLRCDTAWIPNLTEHHQEVLGRLVTKYELRGNLVTDAQLAAIAIEHGLTVCSADTDFGRFDEINGWIRWTR